MTVPEIYKQVMICCAEFARDLPNLFRLSIGIRKDHVVVTCSFEQYITGNMLSIDTNATLEQLRGWMLNYFDDIAKMSEGLPCD